MASELPVPETRVLAVASHVSLLPSVTPRGTIINKAPGCLGVSPASSEPWPPRLILPRNVGNKIAVFTLQSLGCEVAALNTVQFSPFSQSFWQQSPA